ncbi:hypothetical protein GCM10025865_00630 [Paraoerskovia sediminicola]|uniref:DUF222 domain-containing protein n=1 Tax=Paraoerskovia sediminicola TaxID=1138587 RepID=A0ABM8FYT2_9CELL|nr:hypothetical protein [Paraoerskovia sediminicola]BDZ40764.1 hypothetical protein GCM10025865_00630 [Paraoerskovia sediminicola]
MTATTTRAPEAPGRLGEAAEPRDLERYLTDLTAWVTSRRTDLDRLDEAMLASPDGAAHRQDIVLALTLWEAVRARSAELARVWDGGRADRTVRESMSQLIWGRLSSGDGTALLSLVEAVRLCDALASSLGARLAVDPHALDTRERVRSLRAALARCEDSGADVTVWRRRLDDVVADADRGADVSGRLDVLETSVAEAERDLIVGAARHQELRADREAARHRVAALARREPDLRDLVERVRREILDPPRLAVPDVSRLGPVPDAADDVARFRARLDAVDRAMDTVEEAYAAPLRERAGLGFRARNLTERTRSNGRDSSPTVLAGATEAADAVGATPCDLVLARYLVDQLEVLARPWPERATHPHETCAAAAAGPEGEKR